MRRSKAWLRGLACVAAALALAGGAAATSGVQNANPWWFEDTYQSLAYVNNAATTATVDTAGSGTVQLPTNRAGLAFAPQAAVGLIASQGGVQAWAFNGASMVRAPQFDVSGSGYVGAAWLGKTGNQLAVATASQVTLEGWNSSGWTSLGTLAVSGATSVAEGPQVTGAAASMLVGTTSGFQVVTYTGGSLVADGGAGVSGLQNVGGVAAAPGGSLVAVWSGPSLSVFGWDGTAYRETPTWEIPTGSQTILATAWFRGGNGYWVLTADGALAAYGFNGSVVVKLASLSAALTLPVEALGTGWAQGQVGVVVPTGWDYYDGAPIAKDGTRSVSGVSLPVYLTSAVLQSTAQTVDHSVTELQVDATVPSLPAGTSVNYQVSTDGGTTWTDITPCVNPTDPQTQCAADNTPVPSGSQLVYRLLLSTTDPAKTPVVDTTDLYEISQVITSSSSGTAILIR